jgi:Fic family protein
MENTIYTFVFKPDWMLLMNELSQIDRFDASWARIEKREGQTLKQLKSIATVKSVGASTRIEGATMTDAEVEALIKDLSGAKLEERDQQEVAGYFNSLELITESYNDIEISESNILHLHNTLMKHSTKDEWHKGKYKQHSNVVERNESGSKQVIFQTTAPGIGTEDAMRNLIAWYNSDIKTSKLIKIAAFVYDFLSIHPFQDGNGRLSRLLGTLLLLKNGYTWVQYVSFEHEVENRKPEYYRVLMECQRQRPGEDIYPWVLFFLDCLKSIQEKLQEKLEVQKKTARMAPREQNIYSFIEYHPGSKSGEIAGKLDIPLPTVKRILSNMVGDKLIEVTGAGAATNYNITGLATINKNVAVVLKTTERKKEFILKNQASFIEIKKIILQPLFSWKHPDEWAAKLAQNNFFIKITCSMNSGVMASTQYPILASPYHYQPVFEFQPAISIPETIRQRVPFKKEYPIQVLIELLGKENIDFDVMLVYDEA